MSSLSFLVVFLSVMAIHHPLKQPPLKDKTSAANNKTRAYQAHKTLLRSQPRKMMTTNPSSSRNWTPPPAFLHNYSSVNDKLPSPLKMINAKSATKAQPGTSNSDIMALFYNYYYWLGTSGHCMNVLSSKQLSCICLSIFENNDDLVEVIATYVFALTKKFYKQWQVLFISWYSLLNAIKTIEWNWEAGRNIISCGCFKFF